MSYFLSSKKNWKIFSTLLTDLVLIESFFLGGRNYFFFFRQYLCDLDLNKINSASVCLEFKHSWGWSKTTSPPAPPPQPKHRSLPHCWANSLPSNLTLVSRQTNKQKNLSPCTSEIWKICFSVKTKKKTQFRYNPATLYF